MYTEFQRMDVYCDIHPFKETAILLGDESQNPDDRYINANRIKSPYGEASDANLIIAAQGPIRASFRNFWKMCHQENVGRIVTLVQEIPGDCDEYFPEETGAPVAFGNDMVVVVESIMQESNYCIHRTIQVLDKVSRVTKTVEHFHFTGWQDWKLPSGASRSNLASLIKDTADFVTANA